MTSDSIRAGRPSHLAVLAEAIAARRFARWTLVTLVALFAAAELISGREYSSEATFLPQGGASASGLAGLASQLGVALPTTAPGQSAAFYLELLTSTTFTADLVRSPYTIETLSGPVTVSLLDEYGADGDNEAERVADAAESLRDDIRIRERREAGTVDIAVSARSPELARSIAQRILDQVSSFDIASRSSQVSAERRFVEARLREANADLTLAENGVRGFLERNRAFRDSPQLAFEFERLQRELALRQQISATLTEAFERARIEEVRNTPVVTIAEAPTLPAKPASRKIAIKAFLLLALWLCAVVGRVAARALLIRVRDTDTYGWEALQSAIDGLPLVRHWRRAD